MPRSAARWKQWERRIANELGTVRQLHRDGRAGADVEIKSHSIQVKTRLSMPSWFTDAWKQAQRDTLEGKQTAVVFVHAPGPGVKARRYVVLDWDDWVASL